LRKKTGSKMEGARRKDLFARRRAWAEVSDLNVTWQYSNFDDTRHSIIDDARLSNLVVARKLRPNPVSISALAQQ
jgi:hypothetical protein